MLTCTQYVVTSTLTIPAGTQVVGEGYGTVIAGKGSAFQNINSPQVVVQAGAPGSSGTLEITDIQFATIGPSSSFLLPVFYFVLIQTQHRAPSSLSGMLNKPRRVALECGTRTSVSVEVCLNAISETGY